MLLNIHFRILLLRDQVNTKANTKLGRKIFLQLGRICCRRILASFAKFFFSQIAFRNMIVALPKSQTRHPARACAPRLPRMFLTWQIFTKSFHFSQMLSQNLSEMLRVLASVMYSTLNPVEVELKSPVNTTRALGCFNNSASRFFCT